MNRRDLVRTISAKTLRVSDVMRSYEAFISGDYVQPKAVTRDMLKRFFNQPDRRIPVPSPFDWAVWQIRRWG